MAKNKLVKIGMVSVDSGQLLLTDPCYLGDWENDEFVAEKKGDNDGRYSYSGACEATLSKEKGGQLNHKLGHEGAGVAVSTGYGDGSYPVYVEYKDERVVKVVVDFLGTYTEKYFKKVGEPK